MTKYFFHMATRDEKVLDNTGKDLCSLSAAHRHALHLIDKTMTYVDAGRDERWMIEVCSPLDHAALVVLFPVCREGQKSSAWVKYSLLC
jgi:hypothetical protein